jgi:hypothetical protein
MPKGKAAAKKITKMDAMRQTVAKLGKYASATEIQDHLKKEFGIEMSIEMVYTYKGVALKQLGGKKKGRKKRAKPTKVAAAGAGANGITYADIHAVKAIVDKLGARKVLELAGVLG